MHTADLKARQITFNRTIVELKLFKLNRLCIVVKSFNRTIVELKLPDLPCVSCQRLPFNRTIVELKHRYSAMKAGFAGSF